MDALKPFKDDRAHVFTDGRGDELNVLNGRDKIVIFGGWSGSPDDPQLREIHRQLSSIQKPASAQPPRGRKRKLAAFRTDITVRRGGHSDELDQLLVKLESMLPK